MNEKFTDNDPEEDIARKLSEVAGQTNASAHFATELEERLRKTRQPKTSRFAAAFHQISPTLRWVALMALLAVALSWSIRSLIPAPQPAVNGTPAITETGTVTPAPVAPTTIPVTEEGGYDFRGVKLFLQQPLPESPDKAHVYTLAQDEQATREQARALANQFGIEGEMYSTPGFIYGTTDYLISDGKQSLQVHSDSYFSYTSDMAKKNQAYLAPTNTSAETVIREFLNSHGFDFPFRVSASEFFGGYIVQPLAPDSLPIQYESFTPPMMRVVLDESGQVLSIDASLVEYDPAAVGEYDIITAQEAFDRMLDDSLLTGKMEFMHSPSNMPQVWYRTYPDNQPVTLYGYASSNPALDPGKPALVLINGIAVTGNINGMDSLENFTFVQATGQFIVEAGVRKFKVESWDRQVNETYLSGTLSREGDQIVLTTDDGSGEQYSLIDAPADVPLGTKVPDSQLGISGVIADGKMFWMYIQYFESHGNGGGGGGGGGLGFYKLNLSGTPVLFPTATPQASSDQGNVVYVVKDGDTLFAIAETYGTTPERIVQANSWLAEQNALIPGKPLIIPAPGQALDNPLLGTYAVEEGDTLSAIAQNFGMTVDALMQLNGLQDSNIFIGQRLAVPVPEANEQKVEDLRGYLSISIHNEGDGSSSKQYTLEVTEQDGSLHYTMEGPMLSELDAYNALPIVVTGTIATTGKLVVDSYRIPYPDLQFQILRGTQRAEQVDGQNVIVLTAEDGKSYVEFLVTNPFPLSPESVTGIPGDLIQQEVLIIPDETFGGLPVAHVYQSAMIQENGPELQVQANRIQVYDNGADPGIPTEYTPPNIAIEQVELVYFISNPYYQVNDPNHSQRSKQIQPVWHFHGRYENGSEFDVLIQALKEEFLLPELVPNAGMG